MHYIGLVFFFLILDGFTGASKMLECPPSPPCKCQVLGDVLDINCENKEFTSVPDLMIFKDYSLLEVDLKLNNIMDLPAESFKNLKFKSIDEEITPRLDISNNPLETIHGDAFKGIKASELDLDLSECTLETIPVDALNKISALSSLFIKKNKIRSIPSSAFVKMTKLRLIDLSGNKRMSLDTDSFQGLENTLSNLTLSNTDLTEFPSDAVKNLNKLGQLILDYNSIKSLQADIFKDFRSKSKAFILSMRNNKMDFIHSKAFSHVADLRLESLNLQNNRLTGLDFLAEPCASSFILDAYIKVRDNPINCDCDVYSAIVTEYVHVDGKCTEPPEYSQMWLDPVIDTSFQTEASIECQDVTNVTGIVLCERDATLTAPTLHTSCITILLPTFISLAYISL